MSVEKWVWEDKGTWIDVLERTSQKHSDKVAIVFEGRKLTYSELWNEVNRIAKALYVMGARKGDHIGLWMVNRPEWVIGRFAIYKIGGVMIPLHTRYKTSELDYVVRQSDLKYLIMEDVFLGKINAVDMLMSLCPDLKNSEPGKLDLKEFPSLRGIVCLGEKHPGCLSWEEAMIAGEEVSDKEVQVKFNCESDSHIMYTSGTTGFPKGAVQTHKNSVACFDLVPKYAKIKPGDRFFCVIPFFGNIGMCAQSACILTGATQIISQTFDAEDSLRLIDSEKITHAILLGPMAISMLEHPKSRDYSWDSLRWIMFLMGFRKTFEEVKVRVPHAVFTTAYGLVEGSGVTTYLREGSTFEQMGNTVGSVLPYCELAILDPVSGEILPAGNEGEVCTKEKVPGTHFMKGYYKKSDLTAGALKDGWLHSGDIGLLRKEDGYLKLTGRLKDMLKVGGFNMAPAEVEDVIIEHPKVSQVSVVGVPDKRLNEVPVAFVVQKKGDACKSEDIIAFCKDKMSNVRVPRHVFFVEAFPMTPQAKVQKYKLREKAIKELGLEDFTG